MVRVVVDEDKTMAVIILTEEAGDDMMGLIRFLGGCPCRTKHHVHEKILQGLLKGLEIDDQTTVSELINRGGRCDH